jgi:transcriptional regulator with XRE-family HTH domain
VSKRQETPNFIVAKNICRLRADRKITQEKMCEVAQLSRAYYQAIEAGRANITLDYLDRIRTALGCRWADLFRGLDQPE